MVELAAACFLAAAALAGWLGWSIYRERSMRQRAADVDAEQATAASPVMWRWRTLPSFRRPSAYR